MKVLTRVTVAAVLLAVSSAHAADWKPVGGHFVTRWAKDVDPRAPLPEYPRPQLQRQEWKNLNGLWEYAVTASNAARPAVMNGQILVPFSPEAALSGVKMAPLTPEQRLWYRRMFTAPVLNDGKRLLLHFGAVDWDTKVTVNGKAVGEHRGGYDAFTLDITEAVKAGDTNELVVSVNDTTTGMQPKGKQKMGAVARKRSIRYTPISGIWQTVWLETVPAAWISGLKLTPDVAAGVLRVQVTAKGKPAENVVVEAIALAGGKEIARVTGEAGKELKLPIKDPHLWSPEDPFLYDLKVTWGKDSVTSYFGMRTISVGKDENGILRPLLNGKFVMQCGLLDQGYWPDGLFTAPADEALKYDLEMTLKLGYNMARKHVKIEPDRWYYWADKLGVLVWQDMPCALAGGGANKDGATGVWRDGVRASDEANAQFETELKAMIEQRGNHPSIIVWVVFNEGWGQYDTLRLTKVVKDLDSSRLVNSATGGHDMFCGDFTDIHVYTGPACPKADPARVSALGEFGGIGLATAGHTWVEAAWGYRTVGDSAALTASYIDVWRKVWQLKDSDGLSAVVYTQTSDVEAECNGLLTYDREVVKVDIKQSADAVQGRFAPLAQPK